jgi:hypothetical protein
MTICFGQVGLTYVKDVAATAPGTPWSDPSFPSGSNNGATTKRRYILCADGIIHFDVNKDADAAASPRLPANTFIEIELTNGDTLSYIVASGDGSTAKLYITLKA